MQDKYYETDEAEINSFTSDDLLFFNQLRIFHLKAEMQRTRKRKVKLLARRELNNRKTLVKKYEAGHTEQVLEYLRDWFLKYPEELHNTIDFCKPHLQELADNQELLEKVSNLTNKQHNQIMLKHF